MSEQRAANDPQRGLRMELDRPRYFRFTLGAMKRIEEVAGARFASEEFTTWMNSLDGLTVMVWAGLLSDDPELTLEQVDDIVDLSNVGQLQKVISQALRYALPEGGGGSEFPLVPANRAARRHPSAGKSSGPSRSSTSTRPAPTPGS